MKVLKNSIVSYFPVVLISVLFFFFLNSTKACTEEITKVNIVCSELDNVDNIWWSIGSVYRCFNQNVVHGVNVDLVTIPNAEVTSITDSNGSEIATVNEIEMLDLGNMRIN